MQIPHNRSVGATARAMGAPAGLGAVLTVLVAVLAAGCGTLKHPAGAAATPAPLKPFAGKHPPGGAWKPAGRPVDGKSAVYETSAVPPGGTQPAGVAWMNTRLLSATLYSGTTSPGGGPYTYAAPVRPAQAASLVAAFNGGFQLADAQGGYYTDGRAVAPLKVGASSLVIYRDGHVDVGAWGRDVKMTPQVVSVRQNLIPLVAGGRPSRAAGNSSWQSWGDTCAANTCAKSVPGIQNQWRSGIGVTSDGSLVYVTGPALSPLQLAQLLASAGVVRGMEMDINPYWDVMVTYQPGTAGGFATPANGQRLTSTLQGPATFFQPSWARDFVTMSARQPS